MPDTRTHSALRELAVTREFGSYVGVPVTLSDGRVHGTLCCVSRNARAGAGEVTRSRRFRLINPVATTASISR